MLIIKLIYYIFTHEPQIPPSDPCRIYVVGCPRARVLQIYVVSALEPRLVRVTIFDCARKDIRQNKQQNKMINGLLNQ